MRHASAQTLAQIEPLLEQIRGLPGLKEKSRGVFYRCGAAWLHFHEDPAGIFADLRASGDWELFPATTETQRNELLRLHQKGPGGVTSTGKERVKTAAGAMLRYPGRSEGSRAVLRALRQ